MARDNNGQTVFLEAGDDESFLNALQRVRDHCTFNLCAYAHEGNDTCSARVG